MADETTDLKYLTLAEASALASLSTRTLRRAIERGELRAHRIGRLVRIDIRDLVRWIEGELSCPRTSNRRATANKADIRERRRSAISGPSALPPNFLQSGHASSSINGQPYSGAKGEPLREVAQI